MTDDAREVRVPAPLEHQEPDDLAPQRFKVFRWGRRTGKSVEEFKAAVTGHGPLDATGNPKWLGMAQGWAVAWLAPDHKQSKAIWRDEIRPRFEGKDGVRLNNTEHFVELSNGGGLYLFSNENVRAMRGLGKRLKGVVLDECAHFDLEYAWRDVIRPMLMDNEGWAMFGSTTNAGLDGNQDKLVPSYFNRLCLEIMAGERDPAEWYHSHKTARDNPKIKSTEFEALLEEYKDKAPVSLAQEIEAELLQGGAGIAFPEWDAAVHVLPKETRVPAGWEWFAGLDWGYKDPGCVTLLAAGPEHQMICRVDWKFQETTAYRVGYEAGQLFRRYGVPLTVAYDSSMDDTYKLGGPAASAELIRGLKAVLQDAAPMLIPTVKEGRGGKGYRQTRALVLHEYLSYTAPAPGEAIQPWQRPRLTFHPDAVNCVATIPTLPVDLLDPEDVDTTANDHPYDALTYALMGAIPRPVDDSEMRQPHHNVFRGIDPATGERLPWPWEKGGARDERFRTRFRWRKG